jgi:hypothetical protein
LVSAYILARVESGKDESVVADIKVVSGVNRIRKTFGAYDLAIEVDFSTIQEMDEFIFGKLRESTKISETLTVICSKT